jgi:hypothetical protein
MISPATEVMDRQRAWATQRGIDIDPSGYTLQLEKNLFVPLSAATQAEFRDGDGSELGSPGERGKMQALHSSSALACNVFEHWRGRDAAILAGALGLSADITGIEFERKFVTGLPGRPPNLDVVLTLSDGSLVAIEAKFLEPYRGRHLPGLKRKYFEADVGLWERLGWANCQEMASRLDMGKMVFRWLHVGQLLKHILGLSASTARWELVYLWYRVPGPAGYEHAAEADEFGRVARGDGIEFRSLSYQSLLGAMRRLAGASESEYLDYLVSRYFAESD